MEEAMPARCGGAPLVIAAEAVTMTMPRPAPARTRPGTTHAGLRPPPSRGNRTWGQQQGDQDAEGAPRYRMPDLAWVRDIRDRSVDQHVPVFFKQVGGPSPKAGGPLLDGRTWDQYPATMTAG
jgi:hypothetical protein